MIKALKTHVCVCVLGGGGGDLFSKYILSMPMQNLISDKVYVHEIMYADHV